MNRRDVFKATIALGSAGLVRGALVASPRQPTFTQDLTRNPLHPKRFVGGHVSSQKLKMRL